MRAGARAEETCEGIEVAASDGDRSGRDDEPRHDADECAPATSASHLRERGDVITAPIRSAAADRAAKSADARNDACRRPTVPARKMFPPKNCAMPTAVANALQR